MSDEEPRFEFVCGAVFDLDAVPPPPPPAEDPSVEGLTDATK